MHPDEVESENRASEALYSIWNSRLSRKFNRQRTTETGKRHVEATRTAQPLGPQEGASRGGLSVRVCATRPLRIRGRTPCFSVVERS